MGINSRKTLENFIKMITNKNHYWCTGDRSIQSEIDEVRDFTNLFESNARSYKKGQRILIVHTDYAEPLTRKIMFKNIQKSHSILEVTIHQPAKTTTKNRWVGDGYEDVTETTIKYATDTHIHTVLLSSLKSVPV